MASKNDKDTNGENGGATPTPTPTPAPAPVATAPVAATPEAPAPARPLTQMEKNKARNPDDGNINVFNTTGYKVTGNFVHGEHATRYIDLRNIDPELAETLAADKSFGFLEKVSS